MENEWLTEQDFPYYRLKFAIVGSSKYFAQSKEFWVNTLLENGFEAKAFDEVEEVYDYHPTCAIVLSIFVNQDIERHRDPNIIWVLFQTEQLYHEKTGGEYFGLRKSQKIQKRLKRGKDSRYDIIYDYSRFNAEALQKMTKTRVELFYPGFLKHPDTVTYSGEKEYDILFIGEVSGIDNRREKILNCLFEKYRVHPLERMWGADQELAIAKSKICLNLHFEEARFFEMDRFVRYISHHGFVMSERITDSFPFEDGEDFVSFYLTDMCEKIDYYLAHDEEREAIANHAYEKLCQYPPEIHVKHVIDDVMLLNYKRYCDQKKKADNTFGNLVRRGLRRVGRLCGRK